MIKQYLVFNMYDGQYIKVETYEEAKKVQDKLLDMKRKEAETFMPIHCEALNAKGDSVILNVDSNGAAFIVLPEPYPDAYIISLYGRELTDLEKAAWEEYHQMLQEIPNQPGYPTDVVYPMQPEIAPR